MANRIVAFIAKHAGRKRSAAIRILSLVLGLFTFLGVVPFLLGSVGHRVAGYAGIHVARPLEIVLGTAGITTGLSFLLWSVAAFWLAGKGTPVPFASPTRLVTSGPFRYTRNPIKLGVILFYFGVGTIGDELVTGAVMLAIGFLLGTIYHKGVEEKELLIRFGEEYREYRNRTSFLIPWPPKRNRAA
jgi:protein-S-isoprenylcysteine O-methyltransferase Ste14